MKGSKNIKTEVGLTTIVMILVNVNLVNAGNEILLKSRHFTPAKGITAATKAKIEATPKRAHVLIQLEHIPTIKGRKELEAKGIKLLSYIPNRAWFASIPSDKADEITALPTIRAIAEILPEDKVSPDLREVGVNDYSTNDEGEAKLVVLFFDDVSLNDASVVISSYRGTTIGAAPILNALVIYLPKDVIYKLASHDSVHWINQHYEPTEDNDGLRAAINVDPVQAPPYNLTGVGVIAGEWDGGWVDTSHDDLQGRVTIGDDSSVDLTADHATHVAGTMLGNGSIDGTYRGMAPSAEVISYERWNDLAELNTEYYSAINTFGIDLSTNSWGTGWGGDYDEASRAYDRIVRGDITKPILIIGSAGNEGTCWNTVRIPNSAKNTIEVGATNSNDDSMTSFSSRGPAADGRVKPDVVAPGCENDGPDSCQDRYTRPDKGIWSPVPDNLYTDDCPPSDGIDDYQYPYSGMCGTSMSTPAVSGSVALMLEDWRATHTGEPLPSTMKAILIQTATDLGNEGPDYSHGYGKINVKDAIDLIREDTSNDVILEDSISEQGDTDTFTIDVPASQSELKITLVWDDYPGDPAAAQALVNDLDLIVRGPDETRSFPWTLDPANPAKGAVKTEEDHLNNVEQVLAENPTSGTWTIEITETILPKPAQLYSLIIAFRIIPPVACDSSITTRVDTPVEIALKARDNGVPDPPGALSYIITSLGSHGTLSDPRGGEISSVPCTLADNGNHVIYTPNTGYKGLDSFTFKANDGGTPPEGGDSNVATIKVGVFEIVHWWKLDESSGTTAEDSVGTADGTLTNMDPNDWGDGIMDGGLDFDGSNDYVDLGTLDALKGDTVTISAWIKADTALAQYSPLVTQCDIVGEVYFGYNLCLASERPYFCLDKCTEGCSDDTISSDEWCHLAGTYDSERLRIYLNGVLKGSVSYPGGSGRNTNAYMGTADNDQYYFDGIIDDVRIYKGAVDVDEIWDKMYYGTSKFAILNDVGLRVAWFDDLGNLFLKGSLTQGNGEEENRPTASADDEFIIQDSTGNLLTVINSVSGDMAIYGSVIFDWTDPPAGSDDFIIYDDGNPAVPVAYIDDSGDVYLKGQLYVQEN